MKKSLIILITCIFIASLCGCGKSEYVTKTEELIANIGNVSSDSKEAIDAAKDQYDMLSDKDKEQVGNYDVLVSAINEYEASMGQCKESLDNIVVSLKEIDNNCDFLAVTTSNANPWRMSRYDWFYDRELFDDYVGNLKSEQLKEDSRLALDIREEVVKNLASAKEQLISLGDASSNYKDYYDAIKALLQEEEVFVDLTVDYPDGYTKDSFIEAVDEHRTKYTKLVSDIDFAK